MKRVRVISMIIVLSACLSGTSMVPAAEKLKLATAVKMSPLFYLPVLAGEEKGFFKQNDLDVEWVPFQGSTPMYQAVVGGAIEIGLAIASHAVEVAARGVPVVIVSDIQSKEDFYVWVKTKSRFNEPKDLKGARIGVSRLGGPEHIYGRVVAKAMGLEKEVKFVSTGGIPESLASIKTEAVDAVVLTIHQLIKLKVAEEVQEFISVDKYLPSPWIAYMAFASRGLIEKKPDTVSKAVKAILQALDYIREDARWSMEKMKSMQGYSEPEQKLVYDSLQLSRDGKISRKAVENVVSFLTEQGLIIKDKAPALDTLYTNRFAR